MKHGAVTRELIVGLAVVAAFALAFYVSVNMTNGLALAEETYEVSVTFPSVSGLNLKNKVQLNGMTIGQVKSFDIPPNGGIRVTLELTKHKGERFKLYKGHNDPKDDYQIGVQAESMLGQNLIMIDPGQMSGGVEVPQNEPLLGKNDGGIFGILEGVGGDIRNLINGIDPILDDFAAFAADLKAFSAEIRDGNGVVHNLIYSTAWTERVDGVIAKIEQISSDFATLSGRVANGPNVVHDLTTDGALYKKFHTLVDGANATVDNANQMMADLRVMVADVKEGKGTLGMLYKDQEFADSIKSLVANAEDTMANVKVAAQDLKGILHSINSGEGTIGILVKDDSIARQLKQLLRIATDSLEDLREQTPVTTFTSVLFSALQ